MILRVGQLKKLVENLDDRTLVVVPGEDHSYRTTRANVTTALADDDSLSEDYGEDVTPEEEYGKRITVLLIV
jgi:hypothetical protein